MSDYFRQNSSVSFNFESEQGWVILSPIESIIKNKIESIGKPLKLWDIQIYRGVLTGFNEAFIINNETKEELIKKSPNSAEIIRPILRGRDIKKYYTEFADQWLLFIPWHFPLHNLTEISGSSFKAEECFIEKYPDIYNHLKKFKEPLLKRNQAETGIRYEWYALQRCAATYFQDFHKEKIVWLTITDEAKFAIDKTGAFCLDSTFFMTGDFLYTILACLNSKLIEWYFDGVCPSTGVGTNQWKKFVVENIPIPQVNEKTELDFKTLIEKIPIELNKGGSIKHIEKELNNRVYSIFKLSEKEIKMIESFDL